jgi:hypothetical protein
MSTHPSRALPSGRLILAAAFAAVLAAGFAGQAGAVTFESDNGDWRGSWDTTLSYGAQFRVQGADCRLIANANGGCGRSANIDDGNLNYDTGLYSNVVKGVTELELSYKDNYGIFVRGSGFYDFEADETNRTDLGTGAEGLVKQDMRFLDAFAYARFDLGDMPAEVRVGDQVISWGESTFIQGGINLTNPFDVAKLRLPGSELKEALLPQGMVSFNISLTQNFSVEAYYQYEWERVVPDPVGSYYSVNDFAVRDGDKVMLGFGAWSDQGTDWRPLGGEFIPDFNFVPRTKGSEADDDGQYGIALRYYADSLMGGMEFGFYYIRYHSRLPAINGRTGTQAGFGNAAGTATAMQGTALGLSSGLSFDAAVATASAAGAQAAAAAGGNVTAADLAPAATVAGNVYLSDPGQLAYVLGNFAAHDLALTSRYFVTYPEDLDLYGFSWSGYLGSTGIAWQGEISLKQDVPLAIDDVELLFAALSPLDALSAAPGSCPTNPTALGALGCYNQVGNYVGRYEEDIQGYVELDVYQFQTTLTYLSGPLLGADTGVFVWEGGVTYVDDMPSQTSGGPNGQGLRLNGEGTSVSGNRNLASRHFGEYDPSDAFPDDTSWGYRLRAALVYNNAIGPWTLTPSVGWAHDVSGNAPGPGANFIDGRTALSLGLKGSYQNTYELELNYAQFDGAGKYNTSNDRDFIAFTAKVSF